MPLLHVGEPLWLLQLQQLEPPANTALINQYMYCFACVMCSFYQYEQPHQGLPCRFLMLSGL